MIWKFAGTLTFCLVLLVAQRASAEHEIHYRYTVLGYVQAAGGEPRTGVRVELVRQRTGFSYLDETDASGLYLIVARLGDESLGEVLRLRAGGQERSITVRFDPADHAHERGTRVDFLGPESVERPAAFRITLDRVLAR